MGCLPESSKVLDDLLSSRIEISAMPTPIVFLIKHHKYKVRSIDPSDDPKTPPIRDTVHPSMFLLDCSQKVNYPLRDSIIF